MSQATISGYLSGQRVDIEGVTVLYGFLVRFFVKYVRTRLLRVVCFDWKSRAEHIIWGLLQVGILKIVFCIMWMFAER
jgi:hypothetical protein